MRCFNNRRWHLIALALVGPFLTGCPRKAELVRPPLTFVHLIHQVVDFLHHVFERALEAAPGGDFLIERFHDGEQIAVEGDGGAAAGLDGAHR